MSRIRVRDLLEGGGRDCRPMSRAEGKRLTAALRGARGAIELDFAGIEVIGPSFADEVFRVFAASNSQVQLVPVNMAAEVASMVRRVDRAKASAISR